MTRSFRSRRPLLTALLVFSYLLLATDESAAQQCTNAQPTCSPICKALCLAGRWMCINIANGRPCGTGTLPPPPPPPPPAQTESNTAADSPTGFPPPPPPPGWKAPPSYNAPGEPQPGDPTHKDDFGPGPLGLQPEGPRLAPPPGLAPPPEIPAATERADAEAAFLEAKAALSAGDYDRAILAANRSISLYAKNPAAHGVLARAFNLKHDYAAAEREAKAAIDAYPTAVAYQNLAWALFRQNRPAEAVESANAALRRNPASGLSYAIRAAAHERLGRRIAALQDIRKAAELDLVYETRLKAAESGRPIFDRDSGDDLLLARSLAPAPELAPSGGGRDRLLEALALALGALLFGTLLWRRRKRTGSWKVALTPLPAVKLFDRRTGAGWVGKYELGRIVGRGGMGVVYEAVDHALGRTVAIKRMSDTAAGLGEAQRAKFIQEARLLAAVHHPGIVDIYDILEQDDAIYLIFEFIRGKTAHELLESEGRFPLARAVNVLRPICEALDFAHGRSLVHRDLKPMNIMIQDDGRARLMDFGIARLVAGPDGKPDFARTQTVLGTPVYMAPECWQGVVRKESDIYSLGVTLYELLTGSLPFSGPTEATKPFQPAGAKVAGLPAAVDELLRRALDPDPGRRVKSAGEFFSRLETAAFG